VNTSRDLTQVLIEPEALRLAQSMDRADEMTGISSVYSRVAAGFVVIHWVFTAVGVAFLMPMFFR